MYWLVMSDKLIVSISSPVDKSVDQKDAQIFYHKIINKCPDHKMHKNILKTQLNNNAKLREEYITFANFFCL